MDLAANEKAVHADFFNGKDAGIGDSSFSLNVSFVCYTVEDCGVTDWGRGTGKPDACHSQRAVQFVQNNSTGC